MVKRFPAVLGALALVLTGCIGAPAGQQPTRAPGGGSPGETGGQVTGELKLLTGIPEDPELQQRQDEFYDAFREDNPGIDLEVERIDPDQIRDILQTRLRAGGAEAPDVFYFDTGPGFGGVLAQAGLLYELGPEYEARGWPIYEWTKARTTYGGKTYGVGDQIEEVGIFYNKTWFDENGFDEPQTVDEFREIADAAKADGLYPLAFGNNQQWPASHQFSMTTSNLVGRDGLNNILCEDGTWNDERIVSGIELFFREFQDAGYFPPDVNAITYEDANALFYNGQAAMLPTGTWLVAEITDNVEFEPGFFPFPEIEGGEGIFPPAGLGSGIFVYANTPNLEPALTYLDWLMKPETGQRIVQNGAIPAYQVDTSGLEISPLFQEVLEDMANASEGEGGDFGYNIDVLTPQSFNQVMSDGFQEVLNGDKTAQQQADDLQAAWESASEAERLCPG